MQIIWFNIFKNISVYDYDFVKLKLPFGKTSLCLHILIYLGHVVFMDKAI